MPWYEFQSGILQGEATLQVWTCGCSTQRQNSSKKKNSHKKKLPFEVQVISAEAEKKSGNIRSAVRPNKWSRLYTLRSNNPNKRQVPSVHIVCRLVEYKATKNKKMDVSGTPRNLSVAYYSPINCAPLKRQTHTVVSLHIQARKTVNY